MVEGMTEQVKDYFIRSLDDRPDYPKRLVKNLESVAKANALQKGTLIPFCNL